MGNGVFKHKHGAGKVRIMLPDGDFLSLECPVGVSEVMMGYPNHMVVHCTPKRERSTDPGSRITIMHPDQELLEGEHYLLHLVPPQYRKVVHKTLSQPSANVVRKPVLKHRVLRMLSKQNLTAFFPRYSRKGDRSKHGESESQLSDLIAHETQPQVCVFMGWQPSLESISECLEADEEQETEELQPWSPSRVFDQTGPELKS